MGERYKVMSEETKAILRGEYGRTMKPFNPEVQKKALEGKEPITVRPADLLEPEMDKLREEIKAYTLQDEDVLSYALFPKVAVDFFKKREAKLNGVDPALMDTKNKTYPV
jgi:oxaloacetate decarboxylase alpha subunit